MKRLILINLMLSVIAGAVFSQAYQGYTSPTSIATNDLFTSAADDFMRPNSYVNAGISNWFAMASYNNATIANIGYAKQLSGLYIGAHYAGTFWQNVVDKSYAEVHGSWLGQDKDGIKTYAGIPSVGVGSGAPNNRISLLIGVANMGFRVSYYTNLRTFKDEDFKVDDGITTTEYKNYQAANGVVTPRLAWGMTKSLFENGIQPWVTATLIFNRDYEKSTIYEENPIGSATYKAGDEIITSSSNYFNPDIAVGLGGYTFARKNGFSYSADLSYEISMTLYNNEYSYEAEDPAIAIAANRPQAFKTGTYKGTWNSTSDTFSETTTRNHIITPSVGGSWAGENIALKFNLNLPVNINGRITTPMMREGEDPNLPPAEQGTKYNGKLVQAGREEKYSYVYFQPQIQLAAQWQIVPKLTLNAGGQITFTGWGIETKDEGNFYINGVEQAGAPTPPVTTKTVYKEHNIGTTGTTENRLGISAAFSPTENITLEAGCGVATNNNIKVFGTGANNTTNGGLFRFANILVSLKF